MTDLRPLQAITGNPQPATVPELSLTLLEHPFRRDLRDTVLVPLSAPVSLLELREKYFPIDLPVIIYLNGALVPEGKWAVTFPKVSDYVAMRAALSGGSGGKGFFRILLMIATAAFLFWNPLGWGALAKFAVAMGSMLISGLLLQDTPKTSSTDSTLDTVAYSWAPQNTEQQGIPLARWYGFPKVYGNIIASDRDISGIDEYLNVLVCVGLGPVLGLGDFKLNDQPVSNFKAAEIQVRNGYINQPAIGNFAATKTEYPNSVEVIYGSPYTYVTVGSDFDGLEVDITFPYGLWKASDTTSELEAHEVDMRIEVRLAGTEEWSNILKAVDEVNYNYVEYGESYYANDLYYQYQTPQWSEGKIITLNSEDIWWNKQGHPDDDFLDHKEGDAADIGDGCAWHWMGPVPEEFRSEGDTGLFIERVVENAAYDESDYFPF
ncbi:MAG: hypothetical protein LLG06_13775, partial [Desulfobacteraceae bacterium]|nr:hypothetical protein [Desulfobacteraceae bacterium]